MIILKNITTYDILLEDLGVIVPGSSIYNLTDTFKLNEIVSSDDLKAEISADTIIINDGNNDLSKEDCLKSITYETVYDDKLQSKKITDLTESVSYSTSWIEKLILSPTDLEAANYLLNWSFEIKSNDNTVNNFCEARILINDSNVIATNSWLYTKYQYCSGVDVGELTGDFSISIEYRRQGNYQPVYIRNTKISLIKLE